MLLFVAACFPLCKKGYARGKSRNVMGHLSLCGQESEIVGSGGECREKGGEG